MLLLALAVVVAPGCGSDGGDDGRAGGGGPAPGEDTSATSLGTDASLIPPDQVTSPTSGPPNTDPLAAATSPDPATCEGREPSGPSASRALDVRVHLGATLEAGRVRWALTLTNRGDRTVTLVYPTAQDGDVTLRRDGRVAYRWSDGRTFTRQRRCQVIGAATCEGREPSGPSASRGLDVRVHLGATLEAGRVRWALTLTNRGDRTVTLVYPTAQDGDVTLRRDGRVAYRWSDGRTFTRQRRCQVIGAAQEHRIELRGTVLDVEPGDYELVASWATDPSPEPARLEVTVVEPEGN